MDSMMIRWFALLVVAGGLLSLPGCGSTSASDPRSSYPSLYQEHLSAMDDRRDRDSVSARESDQAALREQFAGFIQFFSDLHSDALDERIRAVYADELYFNDTLKTFTSREPLIDYLQETAERIEYNRVEITSIIPFGDDYFFRWHMNTGFKVFGRLITTESIGMTHIRVDGEGRVNFHQDFWDNTEGLFRHLPGIGFVVTRARNRL